MNVSDVRVLLAIRDELRAVLQALEHIEKGEETYFGLGGGIYVPARVNKGKKLIVNVGAGVFVEKTIEELKEDVKKRIAEIEEAIKKAAERKNVGKTEKPAKAG